MGCCCEEKNDVKLHNRRCTKRPLRPMVHVPLMAPLVPWLTKRKRPPPALTNTQLSLLLDEAKDWTTLPSSVLAFNTNPLCSDTIWMGEILGGLIHPSSCWSSRRRTLLFGTTEVHVAPTSIVTMTQHFIFEVVKSRSAPFVAYGRRFWVHQLVGQVGLASRLAILGPTDDRAMQNENPVGRNCP
jgi:hypothetical protein